MSKLQNLLYISPKFPHLSLVFEQNEMLGINDNVNMSILSCRNSSLSEMHQFTQNLQDKVIYPNFRDVLLGFFLCLIKSPKSLLRVLIYTLLSLANLANPLAIKKNLAALILTLGWYPSLVNNTTTYDWIHADFGQGTATVALMLSELIKCPFSFKVHAFDIYDKRIKHLDLLKTIKLMKANLIFSEHEEGKKEIMKLSAGLKNKIRVNYTAVRTDDFYTLDPCLDSKRFVALGRLVPKKGFSVLIKASAILYQRGEKFTVDIYGSGPEENNLKNLIEVNNLQEIIYLKGKYKNENLPSLLTDCIALVMPSVMDKNGDMDGIPTVIYEAMALGRSVIASRISGIPEVVKENITGYLIEKGNFEDLAQKMSYVLAHPEASFQIGKQGRNLVEQNHEYRKNAKLFIDEINNNLRCKDL
jgi:colanic acid/amylovoran biosynthesis glycosyltransferase